MANRQSLAELQERLTRRLKEAETEAVSHAWLAVEAGIGRYLLPLAQSGEIHAWSGVFPVPHTEPWYAGLANLRGDLQGVIDWAVFVEGPAPGVLPAADRVTSESRLVCLSPALGVNAALLVDRLMGLRQPGDFSSAEPVADPQQAFIRQRLKDGNGQWWSELDLQMLCADAQFLDVVA
jgi:twitching motility protein PilI